MKRIDLNVGIQATVCANGETWEYALTLSGMRVGEPVFDVPRGISPTMNEMFKAMQAILLGDHTHATGQDLSGPPLSATGLRSLK